MSEYAVTLLVPTIAPAPQGLGGDTARKAPIMMRGTVDETCGRDARAVPALVLIEDAPGAGSTVWAQPVALLHLAVAGEGLLEVVCVEEGTEPAAFTRLCTGPGGRARLLEAVARAHGGRACALVAVEDVCRAEQVLGRAWLDYLRVHLHQ